MPRIMQFLPRRSLPHAVPPWVKSGGLYFFTLCADRTSSGLTQPAVASALIDATAIYHERSRWFAQLFLVMPDHVHALIAFPSTESLRSCWRDWKRYTGKQTGVTWQRDWFEHRLRSTESVELKAEYIHQNPVRKGLVANPEDWPWKYLGG